ncbi:MAG: hypothetical protein U0175_29540 [Caldilineaceae bacterium]
MIGVLLQVLAWLLGIILLVILLLLAYPLVEILIWRRLWLRRLRQSAHQSHTNWSTAVIYLSGISHFASPDLLRQQVTMLKQVAKVAKPERMLTVAFPYEAETAKEFQRYDLWRRLGWKSTPLIIFSLRNFEQAALANMFPNWYGRVVADCIAARLGDSNKAQRLIVIGNSAGGSILLSAAPFLCERWPGLKITAIMCGGVYGSSKGFESVERFHQLLGSRDGWVDFGISITPSRRWPRGPLPKAQAEGRYQEHQIGDMGHFGTEGYYSDKYVQVTSRYIASLLSEKKE